MSEDYVAVVREVYERYSNGDFGASADLLDGHAVLVLEQAQDWGPETPASGMYVGPDEIAAYTRDYLLKPWADFTMEAEEMVPAGDSVLVAVRQSGVGRTSGVPAELRYFTLWTFRGRKVIRIESFRELTRAVEAAGLAEGA